MPTLFTIIVVVAVLYILKSHFSWKGQAMTVQQLHQTWIAAGKPPDGIRLIDVREPDEFADGRVPGAVNMPLGSVASRASELKDAHTLLIICHSGARSAMACNSLEKILPATAKLVNVIGGTAAWRAAGFPVEK